MTLPKATLSAERLLSQVPQPYSRRQLEDLLFPSKAEIARWEDDELTIDVTPDRLDLLTETGLGLYLAGATNVSRGIPPISELARTAESPLILTDSSTTTLRPAIGAALLTAPEGAALDAALLEEAIRYQEVLHTTAGVGRRIASLGIYPWERLTSPIRYSAEPVRSLRFTPLGGSVEITGENFFADHPMALRYGTFGCSGTHCLTLRDGKGTLLSLPPILNSREGGEARAGDRTLLLESTGTLHSRVVEMLGLLSMVFVVHGWRITPVPVNTPTSSDSGREIIDTRSLDLPSATLQAISGLPWSASEVEHRLAQARLKGHPHDQGWRVDAPPWRPDLLTEVDLVEDLVMARGVRGEDGILPASRTRGRRLGESWFRQRFVEMMLGVGFTQLYTQVLVSRRWVDRTGANQAVRIANPPSEQFSMMRDSLLLSLLAVLERNLRSGYPQRFHEVGPVLLRSAKAETGAETRYHAGFLIAAERAGFADAASLIDYLLGGFGVRGVREPTELLGTIPGRAARLRLTGESVAVIGEIHPEILNEARVPVPVAWGEVDLTALWPLVRRRK